MKKLINDPASVVPEMLEGLVALYPHLRLLDGETVVVRDGHDGARQVALISGGGMRGTSGPACWPPPWRATCSPRPPSMPCLPRSAP